MLKDVSLGSSQASVIVTWRKGQEMRKVRISSYTCNKPRITSAVCAPSRRQSSIPSCCVANKKLNKESSETLLDTVATQKRFCYILTWSFLDNICWDVSIDIKYKSSFCKDCMVIMDSIGIWLLVFKQPILMRHSSLPGANLSKKLIPILMYRKIPQQICYNTDTQEKTSPLLDRKSIPSALLTSAGDGI